MSLVYATRSGKLIGVPLGTLGNAKNWKKKDKAWLAADEFHHSNLSLKGELFVTKCADQQSLQFWQRKVAR